MVMVKATAIRRGFELYECLLVNATYCWLQTSSLTAQCVTLSVAFARSTSTASTFYNVFTTSQPSPPPIQPLPTPVICWPTWTTCKWFTATPGRRCRCNNQSSDVIAWRWALSAWLGLEHSYSFRIRPSPTPSISVCRSPPSNRMESSCLRASRTVRRLLLMELYRSVTVRRRV